MTDAPRTSDDQAQVVLFGIEDDYFFDFALRLEQRGVCINAMVTTQTRFAGHLASAEIIDTGRLHHPASILTLNDGDPGCLSASDIERFVHVEALYLGITDRLSYHPTTVRFRLGLFRALLRYWLRFFTERVHVTTMFFISAPHMGPDIIAYHVAKSFGVQTLFVERSLISNRVLLLDDYSAVDRVPATFLANETLQAVQQRVQPELLEALHRASPWSQHSAAINRDIVTKRRKWRPVVAQALTLQLPAKVTAAARRLMRPIDSSPFRLPGDAIAGYRYQVEQAAYGRRVQQLRALYDSLTEPPGDAPYFLFALHLQPERSTCPQGGVYDDQLLAIETAAKALPAGHELYVKEHPRQFAPQFLKSRHYRDEAFYRRLSTMPNVRLMSLRTDTRQLIRGALATATTTGSAGWESLLDGKPCLAFGTPWYGGCRSCHIVRSLDDCRAAYAACSASTNTAVERDLHVFLAYIEERFIYSSNSTLFARGAPDYATLVDNLALAVTQRLQPRRAC